MGGHDSQHPLCLRSQNLPVKAALGYTPFFHTYPTPPLRGGCPFLHHGTARPAAPNKKMKMGESQKQQVISCSSSTSPCESETEELQRLEHAPPFWRNSNSKRLSKQLSLCETPRDTAWEKRRRQILRQERRKDGDELTDEDLNELKGSIELGFGFNEEEGQRLCNTLPALDFYFAVNRHLSTSPVSSPNSLGSSSSSSSHGALGARSSSFGSQLSEADSWKICSPGDDPQQVKAKLRHWAQVVACSVMQSR